MYLAQVPAAPPVQPLPPSLRQMLRTPGVWAIAVCAVLLILLNRDGGKKTGILARGRLGGAREIARARCLACAQIEAGKLDEFALFVGTPRHTRVVEENGRRILELPPDPQTFYFPNMQQNALVIGGTGWGKSYSTIDPWARSAALLGKTLFVFDFKGHEDLESGEGGPPKLAPSSKLAGYLRDLGYKLWYVAPGFPESHSLNPLDLLAGPEDGEGAFQLADVLQSNFTRSAAGATGDKEFFRQTGNLLVRAILMLARATEYPDIAMCHAILNLLSGEDCKERLDNAADKMPGYVRIAFDQFIASTRSPETAGSIAATASVMFQLFMSPVLMQTFGRTTMPLDFDGRQAVIFKLNARYKATYAPLLAACIQLLVERNIYRARANQLLFFGDEINGIHLPNLAHWLNQNRSSGFGAILGTQGIGFLEGVYGKETEGILGGCGTHVVFHLNDDRTAKIYSARVGEEDIKHQNKSKTRNAKSGTSSGQSDSLQKRAVVEAQKLHKLRRGEALIFSAGIADEQEVNIPVFHQFKIPERDRLEVEESIRKWPKIRDELVEWQDAARFSEADLERRRTAARELLPCSADCVEDFAGLS